MSTSETYCLTQGSIKNIFFLCSCKNFPKGLNHLGQAEGYQVNTLFSLPINYPLMGLKYSPLSQYYGIVPIVVGTLCMCYFLFFFLEAWCAGSWFYDQGPLPLEVWVFLPLDCQ